MLGVVDGVLEGAVVLLKVKVSIIVRVPTVSGLAGTAAAGAIGPRGVAIAGAISRGGAAIGGGRYRSVLLLLLLLYVSQGKLSGEGLLRFI